MLPKPLCTTEDGTLIVPRTRVPSRSRGIGIQYTDPFPVRSFTLVNLFLDALHFITLALFDTLLHTPFVCRHVLIVH